MYVRTCEDLGQAIPAINLDDAACLNRHYAWLLGWQAHVSHILRILGFGNYLPDEAAFAEAVARWQRRQGLPADGIITPATWSYIVPTIRDNRQNFILGHFLSDFAGADEVLCAPGGTTRLHSVVVNGVTETRLLAGEALPISSPPCPATVRCPPAFQSPHATGDATHFVKLDRNMIRVVELAGLFGVDLSRITGRSDRRAARKASVGVKSLPAEAPLGSLSFVAIRRGSGSRLWREVHVHRAAAESKAARIVQALVDGERWDSLPFRASPGESYTLMKLR